MLAGKDISFQASFSLEKALGENNKQSDMIGVPQTIRFLYIYHISTLHYTSTLLIEKQKISMDQV